ncbi:MAG: 16S rRNA (guanine(966)-N(2))-methyltransferase RsmD [Thermodesulfovibrionales bacterium]
MAHVRITAGSFKGRTVGCRRVFAPHAGRDLLRPTSAKVREALFDILQSRIEGSVFIDLFAGTGAVGIEALSRGAGRVFFVESGRTRARAIADFLERNSLSGRAEVFHGPAEIFLKNLRTVQQELIVFADPPYDSDELQRTIRWFDRLGPLLPEDFCLIAEHPRRKELPENLDRLAVKKQYKYGDTMLTWYRGGKG